MKKKLRSVAPTQTAQKALGDETTPSSASNLQSRTLNQKKYAKCSRPPYALTRLLVTRPLSNLALASNHDTETKKPYGKVPTILSSLVALGGETPPSPTPCIQSRCQKQKKNAKSSQPPLSLTRISVTRPLLPLPQFAITIPNRKTDAYMSRQTQKLMRFSA